jgi:hypothetical protein
MSEGGVTEVVAEGDSLGEILVEAKGPCDGARDLHHLQGVREASAKVVAIRRDKDLRLVQQPAKGFGMDDAVSIALELVAHPVGQLGQRAPRTS